MECLRCCGTAAASAGTRPGRSRGRTTAVPDHAWERRRRRLLQAGGRVEGRKGEAFASYKCMVALVERRDKGGMGSRDVFIQGWSIFCAC